MMVLPLAQATPTEWNMKKSFFRQLPLSRFLAKTRGIKEIRNEKFLKTIVQFMDKINTQGIIGIRS